MAGQNRCSASYATGILLSNPGGERNRHPLGEQSAAGVGAHFGYQRSSAFPQQLVIEAAEIADAVRVDGHAAPRLRALGEALRRQIEVKDVVPMRYPDILLQNARRAEPNDPGLDMRSLPQAIAPPCHDAFRMACDRDADLQMRWLECR